jgi:DNA-binding transcriptional MerR regulator
MSTLKIGQVAALAGVGVDTIRYYERLGLLPAAPRRSTGYRMFDAATVERIKLIKQLQELSLTLEEIDAMLRAVTTEDADCAREAARIQVALRRTEEKIATLNAVRTRLQQALKRCDRGDCDLIDRAKQVAPKHRTL